MILKRKHERGSLMHQVRELDLRMPMYVPFDSTRTIVVRNTGKRRYSYRLNKWKQEEHERALWNQYHALAMDEPAQDTRARVRHGQRRVT